MRLQERIDVLAKLGELLSVEDYPELEVAIVKAAQANQWFTRENIMQAIRAIRDEMLDAQKLKDWVANYSIKDDGAKVIGLVLAGNLPLVGFHDLLCCFVAGHISKYKCSSKDEILIPWLIEEMITIDPRFKRQFEKVERLSNFDAVIATGGDTAATYFNYYFKKYPNVIRHNRSSVAILSGEETAEELSALGNDIFEYFGLGCRSVSKLYIPKGYELDTFFRGIESFTEIIHHNAYKNNFDYSFALYSVGQQPFLTNNVVILREDAALSGRISCLHYQYYDDIAVLIAELLDQKDQIQCVSTQLKLQELDAMVVPLGTCQRPGLMDYADGVDVMRFLTEEL